MEQKERERLEKELSGAVGKLAQGKPFIASVCILDHEASGPQDKNHNEIFFVSGEPLDRMKYGRAKVLIEGFWSGTQTIISKLAISPHNITQNQPEQRSAHYG